MNLQDYKNKGDIMKCPICEKEDRKSNVYIGTTMSTLMYAESYYDENGDFHSNDPNTHTTSYSCSNGHKWSVIRNQSGETLRL